MIYDYYKIVYQRDYMEKKIKKNIFSWMKKDQSIRGVFISKNEIRPERRIILVKIFLLKEPIIKMQEH